MISPENGVLCSFLFFFFEKKKNRKNQRKRKEVFLKKKGYNYGKHKDNWFGGGGFFTVDP